MGTATYLDLASQPLVTVVIPAFNAAEFVHKAIDSVLAQSYPYLDVIVVNDASQDDTVRQVAPYVERQQIRLIQHEHNKGLAASRNTGIRHAQGQYVAFLDADDLWLPNHLDESLSILQNYPEIDIVFSNFDCVHMHSGQYLHNWFEARQAGLTLLQTQALADGAQFIIGGLLTALLTESFIHMQAAVVRRQLCDKVLFDERLRRSEDLDWALRMAYQAGAQFAFQSRVTSIYHRHDKTLTSDSTANHELIAQTEWMLFQEYLDWPTLNAEQARQLRLRLFEYSLDLTYYARLNGKRWRAWSYWLQSFRYGMSKRQALESVKLILGHKGSGTPTLNEPLSDQLQSTKS